MSDLTKMKEILDNQQERGIKSGGWAKCAYEVGRLDGGRKYLRAYNQGVSFVFTASGRFVGIYNWKE